MSRLRRVLLAAAGAAVLLVAGCRTTDPCGCEPPRQGLFSRLGSGRLFGGGHNNGGAVIGTTVSSPPVMSGGVYSGPIYSGPITGLPEGYSGTTIEGPILPGTAAPPYAMPPMPPAAGTLPPPMVLPEGSARPVPADPSLRRIG